MDLLTLIVHGLAGAGFAALLLEIANRSKKIKELKALRDADIRRYESLVIDINNARLMVGGVMQEAVENGEANPTVWYHVMKRLHTIPELRRDTSLDEKYERMLEECCSDKEETTDAQ